MTPHACTYAHPPMPGAPRRPTTFATEPDALDPGPLGACVWYTGTDWPDDRDVQLVLADLAACPWQLRWLLQFDGKCVFVTSQPVTDHPTYNQFRGKLDGANGLGYPTVIVRADRQAEGRNVVLHELGHYLDRLIGGGKDGWFSSSPWWLAVHRHIKAEGGWDKALAASPLEAFAELVSREWIRRYTASGWSRVPADWPTPRVESFYGELFSWLKWADADVATAGTPPRSLSAGLAAARRRGRRK